MSEEAFQSVLDTKTVIWHPYLGAWLLGLAFETILLFTTTPLGRLALSKLLTTVLALRVLCILVSCAAGLWFTVEDSLSKQVGTAREDQPLLAEQTAPDTTKPPGYGAVPDTVASAENGSSNGDGDSDSEEDEPQARKEAMEQHRKRLEERGSYLAFLSDFRILIPLVWPSKNLKVQLCLVFTLVNLLAGRAWNVLVPRQLGLLTNALAESAGTGDIPFSILYCGCCFPT